MARFLPFLVPSRYVAVLERYLNLSFGVSNGSPFLLQFASPSRNTFSGSLPSLANLVNLVGLDVTNASLSGPIPSLNGLTRLQFLYAGHNNLTGGVPSLASLVSLT